MSWPCFLIVSTATHCNALQRTAAHFNDATYCNTPLQHTTATHCNTSCVLTFFLHLSLSHSNTLQHCNTLQHITVTLHCNTLQHILCLDLVCSSFSLQHNTTHCNTQQHAAILQHTATMQHTATHLASEPCFLIFLINLPIHPCIYPKHERMYEYTHTRFKIVCTTDTCVCHYV